MGGIRGLIFSLGLGVFMTCASAQAQDAAKPIAIQVVIGADGSVQIIDAKTGKVLTTVPAQGQARPMKPKADEAQQQLEQARKQLERVLQQQKERDAKLLPAKPMDTKDEALRKAIEYLQRQQAREAVPQPPPGYRGVPLNKVMPGAAPASADAKLDLILKQLADLRKDVDGIKKKLDGKQPDGVRVWDFVPKGKDGKPGVIEIELFPKPVAPRIEIKPIQLPGDKDKKPAVRQFQLVPANPGSQPNPEALKRLEELIKQLEAEKKAAKPLPDKRVIPAPGQKLDPALKNELDALLKEVTEGQKQIDDLIKRLEGQAKDPGKKKVTIELPRTIDRNAQLERRIEMLLREVDDLRREIQKSKGK